MHRIRGGVYGQARALAKKRDPLIKQSKPIGEGVGGADRNFKGPFYTLDHVRYRLKRDTGVLERGLESVSGVSHRLHTWLFFDDFDVYANGSVRIYFLDVRDSGSVAIPPIFSGVSISWVLDRVIGSGFHLFFLRKAP